MSMPMNQNRPDNGPRSAEFVVKGWNWYAIGGILLIALLALAAYWPTLNGGFIWDDFDLLVNNKLIQAPDGLYRMWCTSEPIDYWPMTYTTFWFEWRLWNMNPAGYHVANLVLHVIAALLIWKILKKLAIPGAFLAALLFAVHPVNVESVAWIAQRKNTLSIVFFLLSILWYLKADPPPNAKESDDLPEDAIPPAGEIWYWLSLLAFILAMLSKGSVAILPVVLLLIVWWQWRRISVGDLLRTAPFFAVAAILTMVNLWFQTHGMEFVIRSASFTERLAGAGAAVWFYLSKALLPIDLIFVYPQWHIKTVDLLWWLPLLAAAAVTVLLWLCRGSPKSNWGAALLFAWLFFCVALAPVLGFADVYFMRYALVADHYEYIAIIAAVSLAAAAWSTWRQTSREPMRKLAMAAAVIVIATFTLLSHQQSQIYKDNLTLYETTLARNPSCWLAHNNLGVVLRNLGRNEEATQHFRQALLLNPDFAEAHYCLGLELAKAGQTDEAIAQYREALRLNPNYIEAYTDLGSALLGAGRTKEAIDCYEAAIRLSPTVPEPHNDLGYALFKTNRPGEAIEEYKLAVYLSPDYLQAQVNLAVALASEGQTDEAIEHYQQALRIQPNSSDILFKMAKAYAQAHQPMAVVAAAEKALNLAGSAGNAALAQNIKAWLTKYRGQQTNQ